MRRFQGLARFASLGLLLVATASPVGCQRKEPAPAAVAEAAKPQPAAPAEPAKVEPAQTEPAKAEPAKAEPAKAEPAAEEAKTVSVLGMTSLPLAELERRAARYAPVKIGYDATKLGENDKKIVELLCDAADVMDALFWEQASADGRQVFEALTAVLGEDAKILRRYVRINAGRFDRLDDFEPFLGTTEKPLGATFYPESITKDEFEQYLAAHPDQKKALTSEFTIVRKDAGGAFTAVPYSQHYAEGLAVAAAKLREAAALTENVSLRRFLESRAAAFETNDYYQSDVDWMDLEDSLIEVTIGPYEVYEDRLFNYKAAFEAFVTLNDPAAAEELQRIASLLPQMEMNLPIPDAHKNQSRGTDSPIRVVDVIYSSGDTRAGVQTLAFNLPNDERVREAKGSKKVLLRNVSDAKFQTILAPIAKLVVADDQLPLVVKEAYFHHTLLHEMSHGLGPGNITLADGTKTSVNRELKELYSAIEEAKADVLGLYNAFFLVDQGVFPKDSEARTTVTFLAGTFRSVRFGIAEAHGKANMLVFNYLLAEGAYVHDAAAGRFRVDHGKMRDAVRKLATELLMVEALGDYAGAKALIAKYGEMPPLMKQALEGLREIPVDIEPIYAVEPR